MAYSARINGELFFNTNSIDQEFALASAKLDLKAGAAGLFSFTVLPKNKYYDDFHLINDYIDVYRDYRLIFSGRVSSISQAFDLSMKIEAQGLLSILNDTIFRPVTHEGTLYQLLASIVASHNAQVESDKQITLGNVTIQDAACYRAYENYEKTFSRLKDLADSFGGYFSIRKEDGHLYLDWKGISTIGAQSVDFGENLLDITKDSNSEEYISVLIPLGAQIEDEETGTRSRVDIKSVNAGKDYIELPNATTKIVGVNTWDDVTEPANLLSKGQAYLNAQSILHTNIELSAIDLADAGVDTSHFEICTVINVTSRPHSLDNQPFECVSQSLNLLSPDDNKLSLGGVVDGFTIRAQKEAKQNTRIIEKIAANYTTNSRVTSIKSDLDDEIASQSERIQDNSTLIEQNSDSITLLSQQISTASRSFTGQPTTPYNEGDLWYRGDTNDEHSAVPDIAIPGYAISGVGGDIWVSLRDRAEGENFNISDWVPTFRTQIGEISDLTKRIQTAEIKVDASQGLIALNSSDIHALSGRVTTAEVTISSLDAEIDLKVSRSDYNAAEIVLMINDAGSTIKLSADHIALEGIVTANERFKILEDGSMIATNGTFTGIINASEGGTIGGFNIGSTFLRYGDGSTGLTISSTGFTRAIGGTNRSGLYMAIGSAFGVNNQGTVYCGSNLFTANGFQGYDTASVTNYSFQMNMSAYNGVELTKHNIPQDIWSQSRYKADSLYVSGTGKFTGICTAAAFSPDSDRKLKCDISYLDNDDCADVIYRLTPSRFRFKNDENEILHHGLIAQDVEEVISNSADSDWGIVTDMEDRANCGKLLGTHKVLSYMELIADIIGTLQSQNDRIKALELIGGNN